MQEHNEVLLDRPFLTKILNDLSSRLLGAFGFAVRLVIHGGAVMVLHNKLNCRQNTRDVDYCHRSFVAELAKRGVHDAGDRLNACILATAQQWGLGADWMNAHADVALPMAVDPRSGRYVDPIYTDAMQPDNVQMNTVYASGGLMLIGVTWPWAVALKLVRYAKYDPADIAAILTLGECSSRGLSWTRQILENWLRRFCSPMGYGVYPPQELEKTRMKMRDAIRLAHEKRQAAALPPYATAYTNPAPAPAARQVPVIPSKAILQAAEAEDNRVGRTMHDPTRARSSSRPALRGIQPPSDAPPPPMPMPHIPGKPVIPGSRPTSGMADSHTHHRRRSRSISVAKHATTTTLVIPPMPPLSGLPNLTGLPSHVMPSSTTYLAEKTQQPVHIHLPPFPEGFVPYAFYPHTFPSSSAVPAY